MGPVTGGVKWRVAGKKGGSPTQPMEFADEGRRKRGIKWFRGGGGDVLGKAVGEIYISQTLPKPKRENETLLKRVTTAELIAI